MHFIQLLTLVFIISTYCNNPAFVFKIQLTTFW